MRSHHAIVLSVFLVLPVAGVEALHPRAVYVVANADAINVEAYIKEQLRVMRKAYLDVGAKYLASMGRLGVSLGGSAAMAEPIERSPRDLTQVSR